VQRLQHHHELGGRAIGIGDDVLLGKAGDGVSVTSAAGAPITGASAEVSGAVTITPALKCNTGSLQNTCMVLGGAGNYDVRVSAPGFDSAVIDSVLLENDQTKTLNVVMKIGTPTTQVNVTSEVPLVETGEAKVSAHIEEKEVADLPLVGRNFMTLVVLTPGVTGLPSGGGQAYAQATERAMAPATPGTEAESSPGSTVTPATAFPRAGPPISRR
jgi:hypothetical protein